MASDSKRRKFNPPPPRRVVSPSSATNETLTKLSLKAAAAETSNVHLRIQQAKNSAVAQAQREFCTGNFRIFDSPFGNFLVPVIPTRVKLAETNNPVS